MAPDNEFCSVYITVALMNDIQQIIKLNHDKTKLMLSIWLHCIISNC